MVTGSTGTYTVLARRFRPQGFSDVVGQEHVAQALRNAILANRVAHAYLFTGARGVGKTSTARILAKALNCPNAVDGNPCNDCEICDGIAAGNDVDVLEIDGASNRGIDDIRQLRANVNVKSMRTQYKLYIIDEVHMLTKEAFNALLKTLEEPPPNVKFVFCTTEPNKVPDTILSRCQRFDFGTIETSNIKSRLAHIATAEGVEVADDALELVARRAAGSMRDSQSIFDQLLAFGEEHISAADVHRLLGTASDDRLIQIGQALVDRNQAQALAAFHAALDGGVQLGELTDQMLFYLRDLMVIATEAGSVGLLSVAPGSRDTLQKQAEAWGLQAIVAAMQILADTKGKMQRVTYGRALAELALVRISLLENLVGLDGLIDQLRKVEPASTGTAAPAAPEKKNDVTAPASEPQQNVRQQSDQESPAAESPPPATTAAVPEAPAQPATPESPGNLPAAEADLTAENAVPDSVKIESANEARFRVEESIPEPLQRSVPEIESAQPETPSTASAAQTVVAESPAVQEAAESSHVEASPSPATDAQVAFLPENASELWTQMVAQINDMMKSHVKMVTNTAIIAPNRLELTLPRKYHFSKRYLEKPEALSRLEQIATGLSGVNVRITLLQSDDAPEDQQKPTEAEARNQQQKRVYKPEEDEFVSSVMETWSAQVVRVDPLATEREPDEPA